VLTDIYVDAEAAQVKSLEKTNAFNMFANDPFGQREPLLSKKIARRWNAECLNVVGRRQHSSVQKLLHYNGGYNSVEPFPEKLPWEDIV